MSRTGVRSRRARLRLCSLVTVLALAGGLTGQVARAAAQRGGAQAAGHSYVVASGDTLWSIASRQAPGEDPRPLVSAIQRANHLRAGDLIPGRTLFIPGSPESSLEVRS